MKVNGTGEGDGCACILVCLGANGDRIENRIRWDGVGKVRCKKENASVVWPVYVRMNKALPLGFMNIH
jgi:hypothetical protein